MKLLLKFCLLLAFVLEHVVHCAVYGDIEGHNSRSVGWEDSTTCPDRWVAYKGSCYLFGHGVTMTFVEGQHFCSQHHGGHLVEVYTRDENLFLKDFMRGSKDNCYWNGLTDEHIEGTWVWYYTNTVPGYFDWGPKDPNGGNAQDCVVFYNAENYDYRWSDEHCSGKCLPVCKIRGGSCIKLGQVGK